MTPTQLAIQTLLDYQRDHAVRLERIKQSLAGAIREQARADRGLAEIVANNKSPSVTDADVINGLRGSADLLEALAKVVVA